MEFFSWAMLKVIAKIEEVGVEAVIVIHDPVEYQVPTWKGDISPPRHFYEKICNTEFAIMIQNFADENGYELEVIKIGEIEYLEE